MNCTDVIVKLVIPQRNLEKFIDSLHYLSSGIRTEESCTDFSLYRHLEKKDAYIVIAEWKTRQAMEEHFKRESYSVLVGATNVLCKNFKISIDNTLERGSYQLSRKKIELKTNKSA